MRAVADDHVQGRAGQVRDPEALVGPARQADVLLVRLHPADVALRVEGDELARPVLLVRQAADDGVAADLEADLKTSREITLDAWRKRPVWEKLIGTVAWILERQQ